VLTKVNDIEYAGSFATVGIDNGFSPEAFEQELQFRILSLSATDLEVEIDGIDAPMANTLRRIIIAEVSVDSADPDRCHR